MPTIFKKTKTNQQMYILRCMPFYRHEGGNLAIEPFFGGYYNRKPRWGRPPPPIAVVLDSTLPGYGSSATRGRRVVSWHVLGKFSTFLEHGLDQHWRDRLRECVRTM